MTMQVWGTQASGFLSLWSDMMVTFALPFWLLSVTGMAGRGSRRGWGSERVDRIPNIAAHALSVST
jgi:hypothetical protein